jgi:hypothetical protein
MTLSPATSAAELFRGLSRRRGRRAFHPFGVGFAAELTRLDAGAVLPAEIDGEAIVRLSRSLGAPEWLPDPCGLALRVPDAYGPGRHQDLLLASSGRVPLARHLLLPSRGFCDRAYSSILPYRLVGETGVVLALPDRGQGPGPLLAKLRERDRGELEFELAIAPLWGAPRPAARLRLGPRLPAALTERLDFDPCNNSGGGLEPAGWLNRLRGPSYGASQAGRAEAYASHHQAGGEDGGLTDAAAGPGPRKRLRAS